MRETSNFNLGERAYVLFYCLFLIAGLIVSTVFSSHSFAAKKNKSVRITQKVKYYAIGGRSAAEFAVSMSRNGPYSRQHQRRAWATAARDVTYQVNSVKTKRGCRVKSAVVKMKITYTLPRLRSRAGVSKRERRKWKRMFNLLNKHERTHGRFYRQFAFQVQRALRKIRPTRSCRQLDRKAAAVVEALNERDRRRNNRFDQRDGRNYSRMIRIYSSS